jgi:hypothetical protein
MQKLSELPTHPAGCAVYRRDGGEIFMRVNAGYHIPATLNADGTATGCGVIEAIDPNEEVDVIKQITMH